MNVQDVIAKILVICFVLGFTPLTMQYTNTLNTTAWNFTGHEFASDFLFVFPYLFLGVACLIAGYMIVEKARGI